MSIREVEFCIEILIYFSVLFSIVEGHFMPQRNVINGLFDHFYILYVEWLNCIPNFCINWKDDFVILCSRL